MRVELVIVAREVHPSDPPTFVEVGPLLGADPLSYTEAIDEDGSLQTTIVPAVQSPAVRARLRDLTQPSELWLRLDGNLVWAGPLMGWQGQPGPGAEPALQLTAVGLAHYLRGITLGAAVSYFTTDETPFDQTGAIRDAYDDRAVDPKVMAFGLSTATIEDSGIDREPLDLLTIDTFAEVIRELASLDDGFDLVVTPDREIRCAYPSFGDDLTDSVVFDRRNIIDSGWALAAGMDDYVSDVWVVGTRDDDGTAHLGHHENTTVATVWGERSVTVAVTGIKKVADLNAVARRGARARNRPAFALAPMLLPSDVGPSEFGLGDTVTFVVDQGMGSVTTEQRVIQRQVAIDQAGMVDVQVVCE